MRRTIRFMFLDPHKLQREVVESYLDKEIDLNVRNLLTAKDLSPVSLLPTSVMTKYDKLYSLSFEELVSLCKKHEIEVGDCHIKYHIISRISRIDGRFHLLDDYPFPPFPEQSLVDQYRIQLLHPWGMPGMMAGNEAQAIAAEYRNNPRFHLPITLGKTIVIDIGKIDIRDNFHTQRCIYPIGFCAKRLFRSFLTPIREVWYDCWIEEEDGHPLFRISLSGQPLVSSPNIDTVWKEVQSIFDNKMVFDGQPPIDGEEYFGLHDRIVQLLIEGHPDALKLKDYVFYSQRELLKEADAIEKKQRELNLTNERYQKARNAIVEDCLEQNRIVLQQSMIDNVALLYRDVIRGNHQVEKMRADEMRRRISCMNHINDGAFLKIKKIIESRPSSSDEEEYDEEEESQRDEELETGVPQPDKESTISTRKRVSEEQQEGMTKRPHEENMSAGIVGEESGSIDNNRNDRDKSGTGNGESNKGYMDVSFCTDDVFNIGYNTNDLFSGHTLDDPFGVGCDHFADATTTDDLFIHAMDGGFLGVEGGVSDLSYNDGIPNFFIFGCDSPNDNEQNSGALCDKNNDNDSSSGDCAYGNNKDCHQGVCYHDDSGHDGCGVIYTGNENCGYRSGNHELSNHDKENSDTSNHDSGNHNGITDTIHIEWEDNESSKVSDEFHFYQRSTPSATSDLSPNPSEQQIQPGRPPSHRGRRIPLPPPYPYLEASQHYLLRCLSLNRSIPSSSLYKQPCKVDIQPVPRYEFQPFSSLPSDVLNISLSTWNYLVMFSPVYQGPMITYQEFEKWIVCADNSCSLDIIMPLVIVSCFMQLREILMKSLCSFDISETLLQRRINQYTWPEYARMMIVCKCWMDKGEESEMIARFILEQSNGAFNRFLSVDSYGILYGSGWEMKCDIPPDYMISQLRSLRADAVLKCLRCHSCFQHCIEPDGSDSQADLSSITICTLQRRLSKEEYTVDGVFDTNMFFNDLSLLWTPHIPVNQQMNRQLSEMKEVGTLLFRDWVEYVRDGRGPWDEASNYKKGCKLCILMGKEDRNDELVLCARCGAAFHLSCIIPPLIQAPEERWLCGLCSGLSCQECWKNQSEDKSSFFDTSRATSKKLSSFPLIPGLGKSTEKNNDFLSVYDPYSVNSIFFGYDLCTPSLEILLLPFERRCTELLGRLAIEDPKEMTVECRLAVITTVMEIAKEMPSIHSYIDNSNKTLEEHQMTIRLLMERESDKVDKLYKKLTEVLSTEIRECRKNEYELKRKEYRMKKRGLPDSIMNRPWSSDEIQSLIKVVGMVGEGKWKEVADKYGSLLGYRSYSAIREKWTDLQLSKTSHELADRLPCTFDQVTIVSLGCMKKIPPFSSEGTLWPIGFKSFRMLPSLADGTKSIPYFSEVLDGRSQPLFRVSSQEGYSVSRYDCTTVWKEVLDTIHRRVPSFCHPGTVDGKEYFGLSIEEVNQAILHLPPPASDTELPAPARVAVDNTPAVIQSQWHPACIGYQMKNNDTVIDPTITSPIFFNCNEEMCEYCYVCHMPGNHSSTLLSQGSKDYPLTTSTCLDVEATLNRYHTYLSELVEIHPSESYKNNDDDLDFLVNANLSCHKHCLLLYLMKQLETVTETKEDEVERTQQFIHHCCRLFLTDLFITKQPIISDRFDNEYFIFRGDPGVLYVRSVTNEWFAISNEIQLKELLRCLDPNDKKELMLKVLLEKKFEERVISEPQYSMKPLELHCLAILKDSSSFPFLRMENGIEYSFCYDCGCMFDSSLCHCEVCHLDYEPHSLQTHICETISPISKLMYLIKRDLSILEMALSLKIMSQEAKQKWYTYERRAWDVKCSGTLHELFIVKGAQSPFELMTCLLTLERIVPTGGLENWLGIAASTKDYQSEVRSPAAVFLRLLAFDEALRFNEVANSVSSQDERTERKTSKKKGYSEENTDVSFEDAEICLGINTGISV